MIQNYSIPPVNNKKHTLLALLQPLKPRLLRQIGLQHRPLRLPSYKYIKPKPAYRSRLHKPVRHSSHKTTEVVAKQTASSISIQTTLDKQRLSITQTAMIDDAQNKIIEARATGLQLRKQVLLGQEQALDEGSG